MTVSTTSSTIVVGGNGSQTVFAFPFIGVAVSDINVVYTAASGTTISLPSTAYSVSLNSPATGQIWGQGGTVTYPLSGSPIANGTSLTISRVLPLTQAAEISNQGNQYPIVTEQALDILCMEIQQIAARSGSYRGVWQTSAVYNYADIVQDGINGANTGSYYLCVNANTSSVWATDLGNDDWVLIIPSTIPNAPLPLSVANGGTGATTSGQALNNLGGIALSGNNSFTGNNTYSGSNSFTSGSISVPTASPGDADNSAASTAFVAASFAPLSSPVFTGTPHAPTGTAGTGGVQIATQGYVDRGASGASDVLLFPTVTASNSATVSFAGIPSGYDHYELRYSAVVPVSAGAYLLIQIGASGTYITANYVWSVWGITAGGGSGVAHNSSDVGFNFAPDGVNNASTPGTSGKIILMNLSSTNQTQIVFQGQSYSQSGSVVSYTGGGVQPVSGPYNDIKILTNGGNISSGSFSLYGIRRA